MVAIRGEKQVLPVRPEDGLAVVIEIGRDLVALAGLRVVEEDGVVAVVQAAAVGQPAPVWRPAHGEGAESALVHPLPRVNDGDLTGFGVGNLDGHGLVHEGDALAVGAPVRRVAVAGPEFGERRGLTSAVRGFHHEVVLAGGVAEVSHRFPVGRPRGVPLGRARGAGELPDRAVLVGHRVHVAPRLEEGALAGRRQVHVLNLVAHLHRPRLYRRPVADHVHVHRLEILRRQVHPVQFAPGLKDEVRRPDGGKVHVEVRKVGHLPLLAGLQVVGPDVVALVGASVREEVERVAVPHRHLVVGRMVGDAGGRLLVEVEQPDVRRHAAAVPFPGAEEARLRREGEGVPGCRERPELAVLDRKLLRQAAVGVHPVEFREPLPPALHGRGVEQLVAVRVPAEHAVGLRMAGGAGGHAAGGRDRVEVGVAVVVAAEGDRLPVRREAGEGFLALGRAEAVGGAARLGDDPHVVAVDERDLVLRDVRVAEQAGVHLGGGKVGKRECSEQGGENEGPDAHGLQRS